MLSNGKHCTVTIPQHTGEQFKWLLRWWPLAPPSAPKCWVMAMWADPAKHNLSVSYRISWIASSMGCPVLWIMSSCNPSGKSCGPDGVQVSQVWGSAQIRHLFSVHLTVDLLQDINDHRESVLLFTRIFLYHLLSFRRQSCLCAWNCSLSPCLH